MDDFRTGEFDGPTQNDQIDNRCTSITHTSGGQSTIKLLYFVYQRVSHYYSLCKSLSISFGGQYVILGEMSKFTTEGR